MKTKDKKDLLTKTEEELAKLLREAQTELVTKKLETSRQKLKNVHELKFIRKKIAVIKTILGGKELLPEGKAQ